jgi:hypothetical protein
MRRSSAARFILASMVIVALVLPAAPAAASDLASYNGHYYEVVPTTATWNTARGLARASSHDGSPGYLVTITSAAENAFVHGLLPGGQPAYIGLHDKVTQGTHEWVTGEAVSYTNWFPGEPNNYGGVEDCGLMYADGAWNDTPCTGQSAPNYVIEYGGTADTLPLPGTHPLTSAYPECDKLAHEGYAESPDDPTAWYPLGAPTANDIVCLDATNYFGAGTINAAELRVLDTDDGVDTVDAGEFKLNTPSLSVAPGITLTSYDLSGVGSITSGNVFLPAAYYLNPTETAPLPALEVASGAKLTVSPSYGFSYLARPLEVAGELELRPGYHYSSWLYLPYSFNVSGTLRLADPFDWDNGYSSDYAPCGGCDVAVMELFSDSEAPAELTGKVIVEEGILAPTNDFTVGTGAKQPITVENGQTVLNGPDDGYEVQNGASLFVGAQQIQQIDTDLTLEGTGMVSTSTGNSFPSALTSLNTVRSGASLTTRDAYTLSPYYGTQGPKTPALTTPAAFVNRGALSLGKNSSLTAASYTQDGTPQDPATTVLGANATLAAADGVTLTDGELRSTAVSSPATVATPTLTNTNAAITAASSANAPAGLSVTGNYVQTGEDASIDLAFGAASGNSTITAGGNVTLADGAVNLDVPGGRTFTAGALDLISGTAVTRAAEVATIGVPADTEQQAFAVQVNQAATALELVTTDTPEPADEPTEDPTEDQPVDTTPPTNPAVSASHTDSWSKNPVVTATLEGAFDASGVAGYALRWSTSATSTVTPALTHAGGDQTVTSPPLRSGTHYLHVRTADNAGNWSEATHAGPFNIDLAAPSRAVVQAPEASLLARARSLDVSWSAATDDHSGIGDYTVEYARTPFTLGASATGFTAAATTTELSAVVPLQLGARNCMRVVSTDQVGHKSGSAARCIDAPFAATQFRASADDGWSESQRRRFAFGSAMVTYEQGATLRRKVSAKQIGIRAIVCRRCGVLHLRWAGEAAPFAEFDMRGQWTGVPAVKMAPIFGRRTSGKLIVEVASTNRRIAIDSIIVK